MKFFKFSLLTACSLLVALSCSSQDYNWGIGLRAGDPMGITVKKYLSDDRALELNVGRAFYWWGHKNRFTFCDKPGIKDCNLLGYTPFALGIQTHYLFHKDIPELVGLQWYYGFGVQVRFSSYKYRYKLEGEKNWIHDIRPEVDFGSDLVAGLEYLIPDFPITVFADITLFVEIFDNPFLFWPQAGIGGRYNFD